MARIQGFDSALLVFQIIAVQSIHYLSLSIITPIILKLFSNYDDAQALSYEFGHFPPLSVGLILDWREMSHSFHYDQTDWQGLWYGGGKVGYSTDVYEWNGEHSRRRGWLLAISWVLACFVDILPLYYLVRKPTLILDFACTLTGLHFLFSTAHVQGPPLGFFIYGVYALGIVVCVVGAEQLCVRREMREGLWGNDSNSNNIEMSQLYKSNRRQSSKPQGLGLVMDSPEPSHSQPTNI